MSRLCIAVVFCIATINIYGQSMIDSLKSLAGSRIQNNEMLLAANAYSQIGWYFVQRGFYDSAAHYYYKSQATYTNDPRLTASNYNALGVIYNQKGRYDSAVSYYSEALVIYREQQDTTTSVVIETNLAIIYRNLGVYEKALEYAFSALDKLERLEPDRTLASAYNTVGSVYARMTEYPNALRYYHQALVIRQKIGYPKGVAQSYNNIGEVYTSMKMYDSALTNLQRANAIRSEQADTQAVGSTLNLIGAVLLRQRRFDEARSYLIQSINIKLASGEQIDEAIALNNLAELELETHDTRAAALSLQRAEHLIRSGNALELLKRNLELKVRLFKALNKPDLALAIVEELAAVKDSLLTNEKVGNLVAMQMRYETDKKEQHINLLEKEKALQQAELRSNEIWIWLLTITVFLMTTIIALVYYNFRVVRANKKKMEVLLHELHHRVKNNLQLLSSIFSLQSQELTDEKAILAVRSSEARINAMALIHRKLYNVEQNRTINIRDYMNELVQYLMYAYGYNEQTLAVKSEFTDCQLDVDKAIPLGLIMNELISNSFKYAYEGHPNPELKLRIHLNGNNLLICLADNGRGIDKSRLAKNESFGLRMVETFLRQLRGSIETKTDAGTNYTITIPLQ